MNPFPGLRPFLESEAHLFFGREQQVGSMLGKLARTHFLTVVGTSGSGKSSLVNCGLLPALYRGELPGAGPVWRVAKFRPGNDPMRAMVRALAAEGVLYATAPKGIFSPEEIVESTLRMSRLGLIDAWEQAHRGPDENLLIVADQFEELFRYQGVGSAGGTSPELGDEATAFVNLLLEVRSHPSVPIYVVLTMRSDFLGDTAQLAGLPEAINEGQYLVPRMTREERKRAIEGPVREAGESISPVLLTRLVNDVGDNADQLSILQHALNRTWAEWEKGGGTGPLDLPHYTAIGTMARALDQHADEAYGELKTDRAKQICEKLFKALTDKASDPRGVRRPTTVATLCSLTGAPVEELGKVMAVFREPSRSFLMPPHGEPLRPDVVVDISHESLMRVWERLRVWADEEAQAAMTYRRLAETARLHAADKADPLRGRDLEGALLWRESLQPSETWADRYAPGFAATMTLLDQSVAARDAEQAARAAERRQAAETEREMEETRRRYYRVKVIGGVALLLITAIGGALFYSYRASQEAQRAYLEAQLVERRAAEATAQAKKQQEEAAVAIAQADHLQSSVKKQIESGALYAGAREAVLKYSAVPPSSLGRTEVAQRFDALTRIEAIAENTEPRQHAGITIEYFRKPADPTDLEPAFRELGFHVDPKPLRNPNPTNCVWYGSQVPEESVKLVVYALIRAGHEVVGIQPMGNPRRSKTMQVGHNVRLEAEAPMAAKEIDETPLAALKRVEADVTNHVEGVISEVDAAGMKGTILAGSDTVSFQRPPGARPVVLGQRVTFVLFTPPNKKKYAHDLRPVQEEDPVQKVIRTMG